MVPTSVNGIIDALRGPAVVLDEQLRVVAANEPFCRLAGLSVADALGQTLATLGGGRWNDPKLVDLLDETTSDDAEREAILDEHEERGGHLKYRLKTRRLVPDGGAPVLILLAIEALGDGDMTTESERQVQWAELDHAFRGRVADHIIAALSHELAQPLSAISGFAHASLRTMRGLGEAPPDVSATLKRTIEAMEFIAAEAERAGELIRHVRGFVRRPAASQTELDLNEVIRDMIAYVGADAASRNIAVSADLDPALPPVRAARVELSQVLASLLRNAIEAIDAGAATERRVVVQSRRGEQGTVEVAVSDTGSGLPAELTDRIFMPFVSSKPEGLGLGLAICRSILQAHGGRLWIDGDGGGPTTFRFALPAAAQVDIHGH